MKGESKAKYHYVSTLVGLNGAGKTTLVKILSGILTPTLGKVSVMGYSPHLQRKKYTMGIGVIMGQKSVLFYDLPVIESFKFYRDVYKVSQKKFQDKIDLLSEYVQIDKLLHIPVRKLSLGQRMRCEIGVSLIHDPKILFLDEPTLGLDIISKDAILRLLKELNRSVKTTMILTTHDIEDISTLCPRLLLIDHGKIAYDGETMELCERNQYKQIKIYADTNPKEYELADMIMEEKKEEDGVWIWKVKACDLMNIMDKLFSRKEFIKDIEVSTITLTEVLFDYYNK